MKMQDAKKRENSNEFEQVFFCVIRMHKKSKSIEALFFSPYQDDIPKRRRKRLFYKKKLLLRFSPSLSLYLSLKQYNIREQSNTRV